MSKLIVAEPKPGIFTCVVLVPFLGEYDASLLARCSVDIRRKMTDVVYQRKVMRDRISFWAEGEGHGEQTPFAVHTRMGGEG